MNRGSIRWWRAPIWLLALGTGAKSFADNPVLGSKRLNRAGLHVARVRLAHRLAAIRRRRLAKGLPPEWVEAFDRDGFVVVRDFLPAEQFDQLRREVLEAELPAREQQQGNTITRRTAVGPGLLRRIPQVAALIGRAEWKRLLAYAASSRSSPLYYVQTIFGGATSDPPDPQLELHSDTFHPSLKSWFFLTDVAADERPFTYVAGSHRLTPERLEWERAKSVSVMDSGDRLSKRGSLRVSVEELPGLRLPPPTRLAVPANTLVVADTYGFHARGGADRPTVRAEIWGYCRRSPFLPWTGLDPLSIPGLAERRGELFWKVLDWLDRRGWAKQHWRPIGLRRPLELSQMTSGDRSAPRSSGARRAA